MRIAVVVGYFPSISQTFVLSQITGLLDRGHQVDIYAAGPEPGRHGGEVHPAVRRYGMRTLAHYRPELPNGPLRGVLRALPVVARHYWRDPRALGPVLTAARRAPPAAALRLLYEGAPFAGRRSYDALLCHFGPNGARMVELREAGLVRGRIVTVFHGYDVSRHLASAGPAAYRQLFDQGDLFLPVSEYWRQRLVALGCPAERTVVHRMGIELAKFPFAARRLAAGEPVRLLTVARLVEKKGVEYAIRAVAALRRERDVPLAYQVIGDGPLRAPLERLVQELGVGDVVTLTGERDQDAVSRAMREAHALLAPSVTASDGDMEGIPVVLMEAMASGLPVVSTQHSGIPEVVADGVSGLLVPERDVLALTVALRYLVGRPQRWGEMGAAGREIVARAYDVGVLNARLEALLGGGERAVRAERPSPSVPRVRRNASEDNPKSRAERSVVR